MSAVETLREAAKVLRERAEAATPEPWEVVGGGEYVQGPGILVAPDDGGVTTTDADLIATMHPGVALALADWLDKAADGDGLMPHRFPEGAPSEVVSWACGECATVIREAYGPTTTCPVDWRPRDPHALRVAEAILGGADRG